MERMVVVGGGLVGSLLAIYLARRGHQVEVWERHSETGIEHAKKRPAVNITLCERGLLGLDPVGLREEILALTVPAHGRRVHVVDGSIAYQPYGDSGEAIYSVSRATLSEAMMNFARAEPGVRFHFNQNCVRLDLREGVLQFQEASTGEVTEVHADRIFGADGAYSKIRTRLQKTDQFDYSQQYWKKRAYVSLKIPARADGTSVLEGDGLHVWPRGNRMLLAFPNTDGSTMCSLMLPLKGEDSFETLLTPDDVLSFFGRTFADAAGMIPALDEQFFAHSPNSMLTVRCAPWSHGDRVLLIGDAAHAILPSYGQGANAAFEDCRILNECMDRHGSDWGGVFAAFEGRRKPSMDAMADLCIEHFEELFELVGNPEFLRQREIERRIHELYPELYRPLYSMISFSCMPYEEALRIDRRQRAVIDRIMRLDDVESRLHGPEVRRLLEELNEPTPAGNGMARATAPHGSPS
jgi:kynurenine 3-monooxygenase